jgi:hypothetical protein
MIIDNYIDQVGDDLILFVIYKTFDHQMEVYALDLSFNSLQKFLLLQALELSQ